jgi:hypothetical protein
MAALRPSASYVNGGPPSRVWMVMDRRRRHAAATLLVVALVASGCTESAGATPTPMPEDSTAVTDTPTPSEPTSSGAAAELEVGGETLTAGTYTRSAFTPVIELTVDDGWRAVQMFDGFFDIQLADTVGTPDVIAVQFATPTGVYADGLQQPADAADAVALLGTNTALTVVETSESRIGGLDGRQVTVENTGEAHAPVLGVPPGPLGIDPGRRLWIAFFDTSDGLLAIMVGGSIAQWQAALDAAEPVLESIRIGG